MELPLLIVIAVLLALVALLLIRMRTPQAADLQRLQKSLEDYFSGTTATLASELQSRLSKLPGDVLQSITGSTSARTGRLHELLATLELTQYDRLFYLREPVDFVGIKYDEGIYFIEVKSGRSRVKEDQLRLQELVESKSVHYVVLEVQRIGIPEDATQDVPE